MIAKNDMAKVYDTVLSIPGMEDEIKITLKVSRKNLLLLHKVIERGLNGTDSDDKTVSILDTLSTDTLKIVSDVANQLLNIAGLSEMNEKLKSF